MHCKKEELLLLSNKIVADSSNGRSVSAAHVSNFCSEEADRQEWIMVSSRLRNAAKNAYIAGADVEQMLAEQDDADSNFISIQKFRSFLVQLGKYGNLPSNDITLCCRHFSKRETDSDIRRGTIDSESGANAVSLKTVMAFLGKEYGGNLTARVKRILSADNTADKLFKLLKNHLSSSQPLTVALEDLFRALDECGVFKDVSRDQMRTVIQKLEPGSQKSGRVAVSKLFSDLGLSVPPELRHIPQQEQAELRLSELSADQLLQILTEKVRSHGVAVDETFRHFDTNGDGHISHAELAEGRLMYYFVLFLALILNSKTKLSPNISRIGLKKLAVFDHLPGGYRSHLPVLIEKLDANMDGAISLKEFYGFLGLNSYAPDIIQSMTKIFAVATEKGLSFQQIFTELDKDHSGALDAKEIMEGVKALKFFGEISEADAMAMIKIFDKVVESVFITLFFKLLN